MGESDGAFLVMRPLTLPHTTSRHLRTNYNTLLIFIIGEYFVVVFVFVVALEAEMSVVVVATVEHHRIVGLPRQRWSVVLGNIRVTLFFNCWSVIANIREALSKKKLSLCFFVCSILCSTACLPKQSC